MRLWVVLCVNSYRKIVICITTCESLLLGVRWFLNGRGEAEVDLKWLSYRVMYHISSTTQRYYVI